MADLDFDGLIASLAEERDPVVLEEIVCHFANVGDVEALNKIQLQERPIAKSTEIQSGPIGAARWFNIDAAIRLCERQLALIEKALRIRCLAPLVRTLPRRPSRCPQIR